MGDYNVNTLTERNKTTQLTQELSNIVFFIFLPQINKPSNKRKNNLSTSIDNIYIQICLTAIVHVIPEYLSF